MDSVGDRRSYEERGAEKHMDEYLRSIGLHRKKIAKDGSCLFRAVAEQVLHCQSFHIQVRAQCVEYLRQNRENYEAFIEGDFEDYLSKLRDPQQWVGEVEINALAMMYKRDFWIFQEPGKPAVNITDKNFKDRVQLCFLNGNHYDCVYPISRVKSSAVCQSILYELLYANVCHVDRGTLGICHRTPKPSDALIDDCLGLCPSSDESDTEDRQENGTCAAVVKSKGRGRGRFMSERVKRSLNPTLLRNVQFDLWLKSNKAQQKMDYCIAAGMQYSVGDRCQVRVDACGQVFNATVKKLSPNDSGPVTVYSEQIGEIEVPLWKLRPPNETSWSTVVREKRVTNGHGEYEDRGRGRGRGKPTSAPSGVPQATAPPGGRISKQHSWPPQASADEREASSRKSDSVSFGLTEKQRLAREEEERNAALVELRFPDDRSFPALGTQAGVQSEAGKKRGSEKKRLQKNTRRSPVEENGSTSPLPSPSVPAPPPPSSVSPPASDAPAPKPSTVSYASAAVLAAPPAPPQTVPSLGRPVLPAASSVPALSSFPKASSPPTFIAPIAPSSAAAQSLVGRVTASPPGSAVTHNPPVVTEAPVQTASATSTLSSAPAPHSDVSVSEFQASASDLLLQNLVPNKIQDQVQAPVPQPQTVAPPPPVYPAAPQVQPLPQPEPVHFPPSQIPFPSAAAPTPFHPPSLPQSESPVPAALPSPPPPSQPHMEHPNSAPNPSPDLPGPPSPEQPAPQQLQYPFPLHQQLSLYYQDLLYPGFPLGDKGQVAPVPPMSTSQSGDDLPRDMNILRFFFNLGVKSYSLPMHAPLIYLLPLQQAHSLQPRARSRSPSPVYHHPAATPAYPPFNLPQPSPPAHPDPCHPATPYQEANLHDQAPPNAFNPARSAPQAPPAAQNPPPNTQAPPHSAYSSALSTQAPPHSVYSSALNTQAPPHSVYSPALNTQAPPHSVYSPALNTQAPPHSVYSPAHNNQAPHSVYSPAHNTQAPPHSMYSPDHNTQAPPHSVYSPAHNTQAPPHSAYNPPHNTQTPPTAYNAANANSEAPPSSYTRSTPQQIPPTAFDGALPNPQPPPSAYSPSRPSQPPASDAPYPQSYPQHLQWQPSQAYAVNYQYNQAYYHHQQPANGDTAPGLRAARLPAALEGSASANTANVNGGQMQMLPGVTFGHSNPDVGENMMLLVDPPLDKPIVINVPKSSSGSVSPALYSPAHSSDSSAPFYMSHHKSSPSYHRAANPNAPAFVPASHAAPPFIPSAHGAAFLQGPELLSVSVGTEEEWEEPEETRVPYRGQRRGGGGYRSRGRGQYRGRGYSTQYYNQRGSRGRY